MNAMVAMMFQQMQQQNQMIAELQRRAQPSSSSGGAHNIRGVRVEAKTTLPIGREEDREDPERWLREFTRVTRLIAGGSELPYDQKC